MLDDKKTHSTPMPKAATTFVNKFVEQAKAKADAKKQAAEAAAAQKTEEIVEITAEL